MPRYAATRVLSAPVEDVWTVVAAPSRFADWWPDVARVDPGRRGLVPGARWQLEGRSRPQFLRRPEPAGTLFVLEVEAQRRVSFQLSGDRIEVELALAPLGDRTEATLTVEAPWLVGVGRRFPQRVLERLERTLGIREDDRRRGCYPEIP